MGDRANICVKEDQNDNGVYLYTHWTGTELPATLQTALAKKWRWSDSAYLARIIFDVMTDGDRGSETGYGISTFICDGQDRVLEVDCSAQRVRRNDKSWTFSQYVALSDWEIRNAWEGK